MRFTSLRTTTEKKSSLRGKTNQAGNGARDRADGQQPARRSVKARHSATPETHQWADRRWVQSWAQPNWSQCYVLWPGPMTHGRAMGQWPPLPPRHTGNGVPPSTATTWKQMELGLTQCLGGRATAQPCDLHQAETRMEVQPKSQAKPPRGCGDRGREGCWQLCCQPKHTPTNPRDGGTEERTKMEVLL